MLANNDPAEQEKLIKFTTLLANLVIFHNALDIMDVVRQLVAEGWTITADQLAALSPYLRAHITRFVAYATDELALRPAAFIGFEVHDRPELVERIGVMADRLRAASATTGR